MKRIFCSILAGLMLLGLLGGCTEQKEEEKKENVLDKKKVIFIGNSHTFMGGVVNQLGNDVMTQAARENDVGLFYILCQNNGANVSVTNWTFSGHGLQHLFGQPCTIAAPCKNKNHEDYLVDRSYDYVVVTPGVGTLSTQLFPENMAYIKKLFLDANPNAKFICLGNASVYGHNKTDDSYPGITGYYKTLEQDGWLIADWGRVVSDLIKGEGTVPGSQEQFNKNTFIIKDGFHPNMLSGYITAVMTYCVITGETAASQKPDFFTAKPTFDGMIQQQLTKSYDRGESDTNFNKILMSEAEMTALLQFIDQQLTQKPYRQNEMP